MNSAETTDSSPAFPNIPPFPSCPAATGRKTCPSLRRVLTLCLLLVLLATAPARIAHSETVRVGVYENNPMLFLSPEGKPSGLFGDILQEAAERLGWELVIVPGSWDTVYEMTAGGSLDLLPAVALRDDRLAFFDFSETALLTNWGEIFVARHSGIQSFPDLGEKRIALLKGDTHNKALTQLMQGFGLPFTAVEFSSYADCFRAVAEGNADAAAANRMFGLRHKAEHDLKGTPIIFNPIQMRFAVPKGDPHSLLPRLNGVIADLMHTNDSAYTRGMRQWITAESGRDMPRWLLFAMGGLITAVILSVALSIFLRMQVRLRTARLTDLNRTLQEEVAVRAQAERNLTRSEERLTLALDAVNAAVWDWRTDTNEVHYSSHWYTMLGYSPYEMPQSLETWRNLIHPDDMPGVAKLITEHLQSGVTFETELRMLAKDGSWRWILARGKAMERRDDKTLRMMGIHLDITQRRIFQSQIIQAKEEAEAANKAKSEFLANMSHEIRTPLNGIMGMLQLLQADSLSGEQRQYANTALQSARRLSQLLSDILYLSRIEAGKLPMSDAPFSLAALLRETQDLFFPIAKQTGIALHVYADPRIPETVMGDSARLQQVITNLTGNAFKFTQRGSVNVEAYPMPSSRPGTVRILFSITDTGVGIPDDKMHILFEPFTQASEGYTRQYQGAGLGLSICKRLVHLMGGNMAISSEEGVGTSVYFCVTFRPAERALTQPPDREPLPARITSPLRILLAEDEDVNRLATRRQLELLGHSVKTVRNGQEALTALKEDNFDLVLMDIQMPVMDGVEAVRCIRTGPEFTALASIPVIALTAYAMDGDRETFLNAGMDGYLAKPVETDSLARTIDSVRGKIGPRNTG